MPVAGILSWTTIPLGVASLHRSSTLPADYPLLRVNGSNTILLGLFGLAARGDCSFHIRGLGWVFHITSTDVNLARFQAHHLVSVALIVSILADTAQPLADTLFYAVPNFLGEQFQPVQRGRPAPTQT
jgi:hypothetical protein